jgi:hypothetical protein
MRGGTCENQVRLRGCGLWMGGSSIAGWGRVLVRLRTKRGIGHVALCIFGAVELVQFSKWLDR